MFPLCCNISCCCPWKIYFSTSGIYSGSFVKSLARRPNICGFSIYFDRRHRTSYHCPSNALCPTIINLVTLDFQVVGSIYGTGNNCIAEVRTERPSESRGIGTSTNIFVVYAHQPCRLPAFEFHRYWWRGRSMLKIYSRSSTRRSGNKTSLILTHSYPSKQTPTQNARRYSL